MVFSHIGQTIPPIQMPTTPICPQGQTWNAAAGRCEAPSSGGSGVALVLVGLVVVGVILAGSR